ncbi:MAG: hypothetical protein H6713_39735 [Myxococcales bacterium]|nr:hypothetical protein [Myxococcales bacterium]MCB9756094.1 hypothetical protein [Myxococcales bacterium]
MSEPHALPRAHALRSRARLAALAFVFHAPGVVVLGGRRLTRRARRVNLVALALTLVAMLAAYELAPAGRAGSATLITWLVGHFAWSVAIASWIARGGALRE